MNKLPTEVRLEFKRGNFVVKNSGHRFNEVDPDHSTEWLNSTGKRRGVVGWHITRIRTALSRWTPSYNLRKMIASQTNAMPMMIDEEEDHSYHERTRGKMVKCTADED